MVVGVTMSSSMSAQAAYSRTRAAEYAKKYATNYNSAFDSFKYDCTNFVSQCVNAGGIPMKSLPSKKINYSDLGDVVKTKDYWSSEKWHIKESFLGVTIREKTDFVTTSTWSVVAKNTSDSFWGFYNYMNKNGASCKEFSVTTTNELNKFIASCNVGDVLQKRENDSSNKSHSVIVTSKTYDSKNKRYDMKIAYHSNDTKPTDFRTVSWKKFGKNVLWTRINIATVS